MIEGLNPENPHKVYFGGTDDTFPSIFIREREWNKELQNYTGSEERINNE